MRHYISRMSERLRIGIMGAGSIGCFVGGKLVAADVADVVFIGRARLAAELAQHGLTVRELDREGVTVEPERIAVSEDPAALADCDAVLCCVKSAATSEVAARLAAVLAPDAVVASFQNGVGNADALREHLGDRAVIPSIVGFNVVSRPGGAFHQATSGPLAMQRVDHPVAERLSRALAAAGLDVAVHGDLRPHQWTKLLVNLNNAVSALSNAPTRELLLSPGYRRVVAAIVGEAIRVLRAAGIRPAKLRGVPVGWMPKVLRLPTALVRLVTRAQMKVDPQARSSMWEDLSRGRPTEVDYLNGEIVGLAEQNATDAPINRRIVELVHAAEQAGEGSPGLSAEQLWQRLTE